MSTKTLDPALKSLLQSGTVLPAIPLALNSSQQFDEARQRGLARYYVATGAGGLAVAVHSTQFEIRNPEINLFETVLRVVSEEIDNSNPDRPFIKIAGICGPTTQAVKEAETALKYGFDLGLLSMGGLQSWTEKAILQRVRDVAGATAELAPHVGHEEGHVQDLDLLGQDVVLEPVMEHHDGVEGDRAADERGHVCCGSEECVRS